MSENITIEKTIYNIVKQQDEYIINLEVNKYPIVKIDAPVYFNIPNKSVIDVQLIAGETIGGHKIVYEKDKKAYIASNDNLECVGRIVGMTLNAAVQNEILNIRKVGNIQNQNWGLFSNYLYYLGTDGTIISSTGSGLFLQNLGYASNSENLEFNINIPILRNS